MTIHEVLEGGLSVSVSPSLSWQRQDVYRSLVLLLALLLLHAVAFGILALLVVPQRYAVGTQVFGVGLGVTAYTLGMRHAFDADHIATIDNTTRKLMAEGKRPVSVGFWFALGHSTIVVVLAALVALGAHSAMSWADDGSGVHHVLGAISTTASGGFLYLIGILNLVALAGIWRVFRKLRQGRFDETELEAQLDSRGFLARILGPLTRSIRRPGQMYLIGLLFGIGFDTATEVLLLALAGSSAAAGLPWYAILCLPLLFAAGMSLFDTLDGTFMNFAYHWAFANPVRKVYYNLTITGLSVTVALVIGTIELVTVARDDLGWSGPVVDWIAAIDLGNVGYLVVALFVVVWAVALTYWRLAKVQHRWDTDSSS
ncbi:nickel/cobalt efflux system [Amycolatopsis acidiphila]|nr:nickel/cobalt efflux system [Amycolatopsis acidiphila]